MYRLSPLETWGFPASCIGLRRGHDWAPTFKAALCFIAVAQCSVLGTSGCYRVLCGVSVAPKTGTCGAPLEIGRRIRNFCLKQGKWQAISVFRHDGYQAIALWRTWSELFDLHAMLWMLQTRQSLGYQEFFSKFHCLTTSWLIFSSFAPGFLRKLLACLCFQDHS